MKIDHSAPRQPSLLLSDKYKPVMSQAGFPLREETFTFQMRRGGPQFIPLDLEAWVRSCIPRSQEGDLPYLASIGLTMGEAYRQALRGQLKISALPRGTWALPTTPILTVTGPSALVSHIEAQVIWLQFPIQVATLALTDPEAAARRLSVTTCEEEAEIIRSILEPLGALPSLKITADPDGYQQHIFKRAREIIDCVGNPSRVMEAGLRAVSCLEQHRLSLEATQAGGFVSTSNMHLAQEFRLKAVGTTGHEHTQRWGSDRAAFRAVRDMLPGAVTYLLDTYSTLGSGLPRALEVMDEDPSREAGIRFDSEATMVEDFAQALHLLRARGRSPVLSLGGSFNLERTQRFEALGREHGQDLDRQRYMFGQYLCAPHVPLPTRSDVSAVYKLSASGGVATMKFSDTPGKSSLPGRPVLFEALDRAAEVLQIVGQEGEAIPAGYRLLSGAAPLFEGSAPGPAPVDRSVRPSPQTQALIERLTAHRQAQIIRP